MVLFLMLLEQERRKEKRRKCGKLNTCAIDCVLPYGISVPYFSSFDMETKIAWITACLMSLCVPSVCPRCMPVDCGTLSHVTTLERSLNTILGGIGAEINGFVSFFNSAHYITAVNFSTPSGTFSGGEWQLKHEGETWRRVPLRGAMESSPLQVAYNSSVRLLLSEASQTLYAVTLVLLSTVDISPSQCDCRRTEMTFVLSETAPLPLISNVEILPNSFVDVFTILTFATRRVDFCHSCYGTAIVGVESEGGIWLAGHSSSQFLDVELPPGNVSKSHPVLLEPGSILTFFPEFTADAKCGVMPPHINVLSWQLGHELNTSTQSSMVFVSHADLGCATNAPSTVFTSTSPSVSTLSVPTPSPTSDSTPTTDVSSSQPSSVMTTNQTPSPIDLSPQSTATPTTAGLGDLRPFHCSHPPSLQYGCQQSAGVLVPTILTASPTLAKADPLRKVAAVLVYWSGWLSLVGDIVSYNIRIAQSPGEASLASNNIPVFEHDYFTAPERPFTVHLRPGLYSFLLTVKNAGNYSQMARRLVLVVDGEAVLGKSGEETFLITSTHGRWQSDVTMVNFSWTGHFFNKFFRYNPQVLLPVPPLPGVVREYDQLYGPISLQGTVHVDGITSFRYSVCVVRNRTTQICLSGTPGSLLQQSVSVPLPQVESGSEVNITVWATDVLGAVASASKRIYVDVSPPLLRDVQLYAGGGPYLMDGTPRRSREDNLPLLHVLVSDGESGVHTVKWRISRWDSEMEENGFLNAAKISRENCPVRLCQCSLDSHCQFGGQWFSLPSSELLTNGSSVNISLTAINTAGLSTEGAFEVDVAPPLDLSNNLQLLPVSLTSTSLHINWSCPLCTIDRMRLYRLTVCALSTKNTYQDCHYRVVTDTEEVALLQLEMFTDYAVQVEEVDSMTLSRITFVRTLEDVPGAAPTINSSSVLNSSSAQVQWHIPQSQINGRLRGYQLQLSVFSHAGAETTTVLLKETNTCFWSDLIPGTTYVVKVAAFTSVGVGPFSKQHVFITPQTVPSAAPRRVVVDSIGKTSAQLRWIPPPSLFQNGPLEGYTVSVQPVQPHTVVLDEEQLLVAWNRTNVQLSGLEPLTEYSVSMASRNNIGTSQWSSPLVFTTLGEAPARVDFEDFLLTRQSSCHLFWRKQTRRAQITKQQISFWQEGSVEHQNISLSSAVLETEISSLLPASGYTFVLSVVSSDGHWAESQPLHIHTQNQATVSSLNVAVYSVNDSSIGLQWSDDSSDSGSQLVLTYLPVPIARYHCSWHGEREEQSVVCYNSPCFLIGLQSASYYNITATGENGTMLNTLVRTAAQPPAAVRDFVVETADYSAVLSWREPIHDTCRPTQYVVDLLALSANSVFRRRSNIIDIGLLNMTGNMIHWRLSALQAATQYQISLSAVDSSAGLTGEAIQAVFKTKPGIPEAPLEVMASGIGENSIQVQWQEAAITGVSVSGYAILYAWGPSVDSLLHQRTVHLHHPGLQLHTLNNFPADSSVTVWVSAFYRNHSGSTVYGHLSQSSTVQTMQDLLDKPVILKSEAVSSSSVMVSWMDTSYPLLPQQYLVRVSLLGGCSEQTSGAPLAFHDVELTANMSIELDVDIDGLVAYSKYEVQVVRMFGYEDPRRVFSQPVLVCTAEEAPHEAPQNFVVATEHPRSLAVKWSAPPMPSLRGYLQQFHLYYCRAGYGWQVPMLPWLQQLQENKANSSLCEYLVLDRRSQYANISSLSPWTWYYLQLSATTGGGFGPAAGLLHQTKKSDPEIHELKLLTVNATSVKAVWRTTPNGNITNLQLTLTRMNSTTNATITRLLLSNSFIEGSHVFSGLEMLTTYSVTLVLATHLGVVSQSAVGQTNLISDGVHSSLHNSTLQCWELSDRTVHVEWFIPNISQLHSASALYTLNYSANGSTALSIKLPIEKRSFTTPQLGAGRWYVFTVSLSNGESQLHFSQRCSVFVGKNSTQHSPSGSQINDGLSLWLLILVTALPALALIVLVIICVRRSSICNKGLHQKSFAGSTLSLEPVRWSLEPLPDFKLLQVCRKRLGHLHSVGHGQLVHVFLAELKGLDEGKGVVVVKELRNCISASTRWQLCREIEALSTFEHKNIARLVGVCTVEQPFAVITEHLHQGDLKNFLIGCRKLSSLSLSQQLFIIYQVSCALQYLASHRFVHGDIAARNCVVGPDFEVKLSDFGLSRGLWVEDYFAMGTSGTLSPLRWMSPEATFQNKFSVASDVWSFGVLMWEVFSFGQQPFGKLTNIEFLAKLRSGAHLQSPVRCPLAVYEYMCMCWQQEPSARPSATVLVKHLLHCMATVSAPSSDMTGSDNLLMLYGQLGELIDELDADEQCPSNSPESSHIYCEPSVSAVYGEPAHSLACSDQTMLPMSASSTVSRGGLSAEP